MRQLVLDTETTGLEVGLGHRIIEIGCVELVNRRLTGRNFHKYINPDREIDDGALEVHGITQEFLSDKPRFADIEETCEESAEQILEEPILKIGDHQLSFKRRGISGRTPLLFIHGFGSDSQTWRYSLGELSKTREVWTIDLPGHGNSLEFNMEYESKTLFNEYANVLKEFLSNAGLKRVHLIGHSLGGGIALNFALNHQNSVSSLTLFAPIGLGNSINEKFIESFAKAQSDQEIRESLDQLFYKKTWVTDSLVNATVLQHQNPKFRKIFTKFRQILIKCVKF